MKTRAFLVCVVGLVAVLTGAQEDASADRGFVMVTHADNPTIQLSAREVKNMFLKRMVRWPNGDAVVPVDQTNESEVREAFSQAIHGKRSVSAIESYWQRQIFSGRGVPPDKLPTDQAVIAFVRQNRGAIGYVASSAELGPGVKALAVTEMEN